MPPRRGMNDVSDDESIVPRQECTTYDEGAFSTNWAD
jgi:hypothetical protein